MTTLKAVFASAILLLTSAAGAQEAKFGTKPVITLAIAKRLAAAIRKASCKAAPAPGQAFAWQWKRPKRLPSGGALPAGFMRQSRRAPA